MAVIEGSSFVSESLSNLTNADLFAPAGFSESLDASANDLITLTPSNGTDIIFSGHTINLGQYDNFINPTNESFTTDYWLAIDNFDISRDKIFMNSFTIWKDEAITVDYDRDGKYDDVVIGVTNSIGASDGNIRDWMYIFIDTSPTELGYYYDNLTETYIRPLDTYPPNYVITDKETSKEILVNQYSSNTILEPEPTPRPQDYEPPNAEREINGTKKDDALKGTKKSDFINGKKGNDTLAGRRGGDHLKGGNGQDLLTGAKGKDYLDGSKGIDVLNGGDGADVFQISQGVDLVEDFNIKQGDRIALDKKGKYSIIEDTDGVLIMSSAKKQLFLDGVNYDDVIAAGIDLFVQPV